MPWPDAEFDVDEVLVRSLLEEQMRDLRDLPLRAIGEGFDNALWRLGDRYLLRFPRRRIARELLLHEIKWLPILAPRLPIPVPVPLRVGQPSHHYESPWVLTTWFDGVAGDQALVRAYDTVSTQLGSFLRALHVPSPPDAPYNPFRSTTLKERTESFEERLARAPDGIDRDALRTLWHAAIAGASDDAAPVWIHGDLHPGNIVIDEETIIAVIDFGDVCGGDRATDLAGALLLLPDGLDENFVAAYGELSDELRKRTRGWAVLFALMYFELGTSDHVRYRDIGRDTLQRLISDFT